MPSSRQARVCPRCSQPLPARSHRCFKCAVNKDRIRIQGSIAPPTRVFGTELGSDTVDPRQRTQQQHPPIRSKRLADFELFSDPPERPRQRPRPTVHNSPESTDPIQLIHDSPPLQSSEFSSSDPLQRSQDSQFRPRPRPRQIEPQLPPQPQPRQIKPQLPPRPQPRQVEPQLPPQPRRDGQGFNFYTQGEGHEDAENEDKEDDEYEDNDGVFGRGVNDEEGTHGHNLNNERDYGLNTLFRFDSDRVRRELELGFGEFDFNISSSQPNDNPSQPSSQPSSQNLHSSLPSMQDLNIQARRLLAPALPRDYRSLLLHLPFEQHPPGFISKFNPQIQIHYLGNYRDPTYQCRHCFAYHWPDERVLRSSKTTPEYEKCCKKGAIQRPPLPPPPEPLFSLMKSEHPLSPAFWSTIHNLNAAMSFCSLQFTKDPRLGENPSGIRVFSLQGRMLHRYCPDPFIPVPGQNAVYAQIYLYHVEQQVEMRQAHRGNQEIPLPLLTEISHMVNEHNHFARTLSMCREAVEHSPEDHPSARAFLTTDYSLHLQQGRDKNRENLPTADEVAAIVPFDAANPNFNDLLVYRREPRPGESKLYEISLNHPARMPLAYVILFPSGGDQGVSPLTAYTYNDQIMTLQILEHYRNLLHERSTEFNTILSGRRLTQQFFVDLFATVDASRIYFCKHNQKKLRSDLYNKVVQADNAARAEGREANLADHGKPYILPSSYVGGDRAMKELFYDAMAIMNHYGKPDLFITYTANPKCREMQEALKPGFTAVDRADLMVRVFDLKVKAFLKDITTDKDPIFGPAKGYTYTVEYQKRALPHIHVLIFLDHTHPAVRDFLNPDHIDQIVCAELPSPEIDPEGTLAEIVRSRMMHGPCNMPVGERNRPACRKTPNITASPKCQKGFPKEWQDETQVNAKSFPWYRRRLNTPYRLRHPDGRVTTESSGIFNQWVVPYSPYLCMKYNAHINVEISLSIASVKYIFKYIHKGHDLTNLKIDNKNDECEVRLASRYIGPCEAMWRVFECHTHGNKPTVQRLDLHLKGENSVSWDDDEETVEEMLARTNNGESLLTNFFAWNRSHPEEEVFYLEFPYAHVVTGPRKKNWKNRKSGRAIGRLRHVNASHGEVYYLYRLLTKVPSPQGFDELLEFEGQQHASYKEVCLARGIISGDNDLYLQFEEAGRTQSGLQIRSLLAWTLVYDQCVSPRELWDKIKETVCEDLARRIERDGIAYPADLENPHHDFGLYLLAKELEEMGRTLTSYHLNAPRYNWGHAGLNFSLVARELCYDTTAQEVLLQTKLAQLNHDQRAAYNTLLNTISVTPEKAQFFLQGPAGTGKTFLYETVCHKFRSEAKIVLCVASSGIAALLLPGGTTAHYRFKIPVPCKDDTYRCNVPRGTQVADLLGQADLIIWDEAPMSNQWCYNAVDQMLRDIRRKPDLLFGGIPFLAGGDFAQTLPVTDRSNRAMAVYASLSSWPYFKNRGSRHAPRGPEFIILRLKANMRLRQDPANSQFARWLEDMPYNEDTYGFKELPPQVHCIHDLDRLIAFVYPIADLEAVQEGNYDLLRGRALLSSTNADVDTLNDKISQQIFNCSGTKVRRQYCAIDERRPEDGNHTDIFQTGPDYFDKIQPKGFPAHQLDLREGMLVMIMRNVAPQKGLVNGTRLILTELTRWNIKGRILGSSFNGREYGIPRILFHTDPDYSDIHFSRRQFPLRVCYAMTINKSQGQSLQRVGLDLRSPVFSHGQLYVALSRCTDVANMRVLLNPHPNDPQKSRSTENLVFDEALLPLS